MGDFFSVVFQIVGFAVLMGLIYIMAQVLDVIREERERLGLMSYWEARRRGPVDYAPASKEDGDAAV